MNFSSCQRVAWLLLRGMKLAAHQSVLLPTIKCKSSNVMWNVPRPAGTFDITPGPLKCCRQAPEFPAGLVHICPNNRRMRLFVFTRVDPRVTGKCNIFQELFHTGTEKASASNVTVVCSARLCFVWEWRLADTVRRETRPRGGFQTCEMDTVNFIALTGNTDIFPRRL